MRRVGVVLLATLALCGAACADGDPASDYLYQQKLFLPFDVKVPAARQSELASTIEGVNRAGYPIRVAVIGSAYDLGAVPSLWRKPRSYARFLGTELAFVYKQRLLIVMPNGFGFYRHGRPVAHEEELLQGIRVEPGAEGLVDAAQTAVTKLASDAGVDVKPVAAPPSTANRDRLIIIVAALAAIVLAVVGRLALRRRHR